MGTTSTGERVEHTQAHQTWSYRAVSLWSRAAMRGAQIGIRSLVAAWMAAPEFPWPTSVIDNAARWLPRPRHTQIGEIALPNCRAEWIRAECSGT